MSNRNRTSPGITEWLSDDKTGITEWLSDDKKSGAESDRKKAWRTLVSEQKEDVQPVKIKTKQQLSDENIENMTVTDNDTHQVVTALGQRESQEDAAFHQVFDVDTDQINEDQLHLAVTHAPHTYAQLLNETLEDVAASNGVGKEYCPGTTLSMAIQIPKANYTLIGVSNIGDSPAMVVTKNSEDQWMVIPLTSLHQVADKDEEKRIEDNKGKVLYGNHRGFEPYDKEQWIKDHEEGENSHFIRLKGNKSHYEVSRSIGDIDVVNHGAYYCEPSSTIIRVNKNRLDKTVLIQMTDGIFSKSGKLTVKQIEDIINQEEFRDSPEKWAELLTSEVTKQGLNTDNSAIVVSHLAKTTQVTVSGVADEHRRTVDDRLSQKQKEAYGHSGDFSQKVAAEIPTATVNYFKYPKEIAECLAKICMHSFDLKFSGGSTLKDAKNQEVTFNNEPKKVARTALKIYQILTTENIEDTNKRITKAIDTLKKACGHNRSSVSHFFRSTIIPSAFKNRTDSTRIFYSELLSLLESRQVPDSSENQSSPSVSAQL